MTTPGTLSATAYLVLYPYSAVTLGTGPFYPQSEDDLYGNDFLKRENFCNWIRRKMRTDISFWSYVLFSDEANFANTRNVYRHNMHYWANENLRWMRTAPFQHLWSVNCWCGIADDNVIGP